MTRALWPHVFGRQLGEQRIVLDNLSDRILRKPISPLIEWIGLQDCSIDDAATSTDALKHLQQTHRRFVLLLGRNQAVVGMLTRSLLVSEIFSNSSPKTLKDFATKRNRIVTIDADATVRLALQAFHKYSFNQLLVFDKDNNEVGTLMRTAVLRWVTEQLLDE